MPCKPDPAGYTAKFVEWTRDPGIAVFECSDGKLRLIPTYAIKGDHQILPEQDYSNKIYFGGPCVDTDFINVEEHL